MKFLKDYYKFNEETDFDVKPTDAIDLKASKETLETVNKNLKDFKQKKPIIDTLFKKNIDDKQLQVEVSKIIGLGKEKRNPFVVNYLQVAQDQKRMDNLILSLSSDKKSVEEFKTLMSSASDQSHKDQLQKSITDLNKKIQDSTKSISILSKDIETNKKRVEGDMSRVEGDIKNKIKTIEDTRK